MVNREDNYCIVTLRSHWKSYLENYRGRRHRNLCLQVKPKGFNLKCPLLCITETYSVKRNNFFNIYKKQCCSSLKCRVRVWGDGGIGFAIVTIMAQHTSKTDLKIFLNPSDFKGINTCSVVIAYMQRDNIPLIVLGRKSMFIYQRCTCNLADIIYSRSINTKGHRGLCY